LSYTVKGEKVGLKPIKREDAQVWLEWFNDLEVTQYLSTFTSIMSIEKEEEFYERVSDSETDKVFSIYELNEEKLIGNCGLHNIDLANKSAMMGIVIGKKSHWNKGLGTEATILILDYGFTVLGLNSINLYLKEFNNRARKAYQKAGFKDAGRLRNHWFLDGDYYDSQIMDMLKEEFFELHESTIKNRYLHKQE